jgi:hypothetical protein
MQAHGEGWGWLMVMMVAVAVLQEGRVEVEVVVSNGMVGRESRDALGGKCAEEVKMSLALL